MQTTSLSGEVTTQSQGGIQHSVHDLQAGSLRQSGGRKENGQQSCGQKIQTRFETFHLV